MKLILSLLFGLIAAIVLFGLCFMAISAVMHMADYEALIKDNIGYICVASAILAHTAMKLLDDVFGGLD